MKYWLMKTEPSTFSIEDLERAPKRTTHWDGVRNYQARNMLRDEIAKGDQVFLYHSSCEVPAIVGIAKVTRAGYPDHTQFDPKHDHYDPASTAEAPRWYMVDVTLEKRFPREIKLETLRAHAKKELDGLLLLRAGNRLSVMPVDAAHWKFILTLA